MPVRSLDLNLLLVLATLLEERNVTRAARALNLSQPAISNALHRLRLHYGDRLFVRLENAMRPTPFLESIADQVLDIVGRAEQLGSSRAAFDAETSDRTFSIIAHDHPSVICIAKLVKAVERQAPSVTIRARQFGPDLEEDLRSADLIILSNRWLLPEHPGERVYRDDYVCMVSRDNDTIGSSMTKGQFLAARHVVMTHGHENSFFARRQRAVAVEADSFALIPYLVADTPYVATVPERIGRLFTHAAPVRLVPHPFEIAPIEFYAQWHRNKAGDPGLTWLRNILTEVSPTAQPDHDET
jgi:DNA-binding transcriptional LysR family regulator